jgi:methylenetetrahydrofolate--tRNA-(uracil-5-)-methyltransferase
MTKVLVIGAGLAGTECAMFLARKGISVVLMESKRKGPNPSQKIPDFAELVCTNSLKSKNPDSGHGLLKYEMRGLGSLILEMAELTAVPAGDALAVDREKFSRKVTEAIEQAEKIEVIDQEVIDPLASMKEHDCQYAVVATGPLTTSGLENWLQSDFSKDSKGDLYFYDAIAPVVDADGLDYSKLYYKDRHKPVPEDEGESADYLNAPMNKEEYENFIQALIHAEKTPPKEFENWKFFESCLPVDLMAERGVETARFSCMKPIGLELPNGEVPHACVQLRRENLQGTAFNLVGFQTRLKYPEQIRVFRMIPGLEEASFLHLGSVHRNTFVNAKKLLNRDLSSKEFPNLYFAGQITGVEGYTESASFGLMVADQIWRKIEGQPPLNWPKETGIGALIHYVMTVPKPCPSNINFGLLPPVELTKEERRDRKNRKKVKKAKASLKAREAFDQMMAQAQGSTPS